jgi:hypothetical protein
MTEPTTQAAPSGTVRADVRFAVFRLETPCHHSDERGLRFETTFDTETEAHNYAATHDGFWFVLPQVTKPNKVISEK